MHYNCWVPFGFVVVLVGQLEVVQTQDSYNKPNFTCFEHFTVTSLFNTDETTHFSQIHLNISWPDGALNRTDNLTISTIPTNLDEDCYKVEDIHYSLMSMNESYIMRPPLDMTPETEVSNGCNYIIKIKTGTCKLTKTYTVPECVGEKCNCTHHSPRVTITGHTFQPDKNLFVVTWQTRNSLKGRPYNITGVSEVTLYGERHDRFYDAVDRIDDLDRGVSSFKVDKIPRGEKYIMRLGMENNFHCHNDTANYVFYVPETSSGQLPTFLVVLIAVAPIVLVVVVLNREFVVKCFKKVGFILPERFNRIVSQPQPSQNNAVMIAMLKNYQYTPMEFLEGCFDAYEFPKSKLQLQEIIGHGAFGQVHSAKAFNIGGVEGYKMVAVKTLGDNISCEAVEDFIAEIEIFKKIGVHPNIVRLLGCCTLEPPYMLIMEFVPCGDLKNYLLDLRKQWLKQKSKCKPNIFFPDDSDGAYIQPETPSSPVSVTTSRLPSTTETILTNIESPRIPQSPLTPFMLRTPLLPQTPSSLSFYIESPLMTPRGPDSPRTPTQKQLNYTLEKILDPAELQNFALQIAQGMAHLESIPITHRDLAARNILINEFKELKISDFGLSRKGPYTNQKTKRLPLRWMALESILQQKYDSRSDVWSFGIVLWEIATLAAFPYENVPDTCLVQFLKMGDRLQRPEICTDDLYSVMLNCWQERPEDRPTFEELVESLDVKKKKVYVDFDMLNPTYMFPPSAVEDKESVGGEGCVDIDVGDDCGKDVC